MSRHLKLLHRSFAGGELSTEMYSRPDDARSQAGASLMLNCIPRPSGSVLKRPGLEMVRKAKNGGIGRVRLLPFVFSEGDTFTIEAGRALIDAREIGYMRFHTEGGTLLYDKPPDYVPSKAMLAGALGFLGTACTASAAHLLTTGDQVALTMYPNTAVVFDIATQEILLPLANTLLKVGSRVSFAFTTAPKIGRLYGPWGSFPPPVNVIADKVYFVTRTSATGFMVSEENNGEQYAVSFAGAGVTASALPSIAPLSSSGAVTGRLHARVTSGTTFTLHSSAAEAFANINVYTTSKPGFGSVRVHKVYESGDLIYWPGAGAGPFACMRTPHTSSMRDGYAYLDDHLGHAPPAHLEYWCRVSGDYSAVTASSGTDKISWGGAHTFVDGDTVIFGGGTAPAPLAFGTVYYLRNCGATDFEVSLTPFGPKVDLTTNGVAVTAFVNSYYEIPHRYTETDLFRLTTAQSNDVLGLAVNSRPFSELRRLGAAEWSLQIVDPGSTIAAPTGLACASPIRGRSIQVTTNVAGLKLITAVAHEFADEETVFIYGLESASLGGYYSIKSTTAPGSTDIFLKSFYTGADVTALLVVDAAVGYISPADGSIDVNNEYRVTAVDSNGVESDPSSSITVVNNLYVQGASNTLTWNGSIGAVRYRVYKKSLSIFGFIGEADSTFFTDDGTKSPDLSVTPPIRDDSLLRTFAATFDIASSLVVCPGHGFANNTPVIFENNYSSTSGLPTGIVDSATYYVVGAGSDSFQIADEPNGVPLFLSGTHNGATIVRGGAFPGTVSYFEGRRCFGGSSPRPQDVWMTSSSTESDISYSIPTVDSDRILFRVATREAASVRHIVPMSHLLLLTNSSEIRLTPINDDAVTPTSISLRPQSYVGSSFVQPVVVNNSIVFVAARGGHVRELGFNIESSSYLTGDLSLRSAHLFDGFTILQESFAKAPIPVLHFVSSSGKLLGMTYVPEEQVGAWHQHTTDGVFESAVSVPEGEEDRTYASVARYAPPVSSSALVAGQTYKIVSVGTSDFTLCGAASNTVGLVFVASSTDAGTGTAAPLYRYIERFARHEVAAIADYFGVDNGITYRGPATTTILVPHLAGMSVAYLADGIAGTGVVSSAGILTLSKAASVVHVGRPFTSEIRTMPMAMQVDAFGSGKTKNVNAVWVRVKDSAAFEVGPTSALLTPSLRPSQGSLFNGLVPVTIQGEWSDEGQLVIRQSKPLPLHVLGLTLEVATGG